MRLLLGILVKASLLFKSYINLIVTSLTETVNKNILSQVHNPV